MMIEFQTCEIKDFDLRFFSLVTDIILENILFGSLEKMFRHGVQIETPT